MATNTPMPMPPATCKNQQMSVAESDIPTNELDSSDLVNKVDVDETADHQTHRPYKTERELQDSAIPESSKQPWSKIGYHGDAR